MSFSTPLITPFSVCTFFIIFSLATTADGSFISDIVADNYPESKAKNSTLELLHVMFRHGPRTPVDTYPNDPYLNETFYPYGWGHLTSGAKIQLFQFGIWLRRRYGKLLGSFYQNDVLHAQSTASPRTLMSMATVLAGMFPPKKTPMEWDVDFNWQPIPIYSDPLQSDTLLRMTASCPRYDDALHEVLELPEVKKQLAEYESLFHELTEIAGMNISTAHDVNSLYITLWAEQIYGLNLPKWTEIYYPDKMRFLAEQNYIYNVYTKEMQRIKGGPFLQKMYDEMQAKRNSSLTPEKRRLYLYCAHDWTIVNILAALGVWERKMPAFTAFAAFELHKNNESGEYYVEIYLQNGLPNDVEKLTVPGCDFQCPLDKLIELTKDVLPDGSYVEMCRPNKNHAH